MLVNRCLPHRVSPLVSSLFIGRSLGPRTRGQRTVALVLPRTFSRYGYHSVSSLAADKWNALPSERRQARSPSQFVILTKQYLWFPVKRHSLLGLPLINNKIYYYYPLDLCERHDYRVISSAYRDNKLLRSTDGSIRMHNENRSGPRTEPCGTPRVASNSSPGGA